MNWKYVLAVLLLLTVPVQGAEIYGKIYRWDTLDIVEGAVVEIEDGITQRMVSENGSYSFTVPPGEYTLRAVCGELAAVENVTVKNTTRFDLILFPNLSIVEPVPEFPEVPEEPPYYLAVAGVAGAIVLLLYLLKRKEQIAEQAVDVLPQPQQTPQDLPDDLIEVLEILRNAGGRMTQKELRKRLGYSEAKMSLIIADLERRGLVEKVKKGRGNIIFLR